MQPSSNKAVVDDALPEATDEFLEKYRLKFSVMTNVLAGGCLVSPVTDSWRNKYYRLEPFDVITLTSMIQLLLKRVELDREAYKTLEQKSTGGEKKLEALIGRVSSLQEIVESLREWKLQYAEKFKSVDTEVHKVETLQEENQRLRQEVESLKYQNRCFDRTLENAKVDLILSKAELKKQEECFTRKMEQLNFFVRVLIGVYHEIDIYYVRNLVKQLLNANEDS